MVKGKKPVKGVKKPKKEFNADEEVERYLKELGLDWNINFL